MFQCTKPSKQKRKSSGWRKAVCMRANKSLNTTDFADDFSSPSKAPRLSSHLGTSRLPVIRESLYEEIPASDRYADDKENMEWHGIYTSNPSKSNLYPRDLRSVSAIASFLDKQPFEDTDTSSAFYYNETISDKSEMSYKSEAPAIQEAMSCPIVSVPVPTKIQESVSSLQSTTRPSFSETQNKAVTSLSGTHGDSAYRSGTSLTLEESDLGTDGTRFVSTDSGFTSQLSGGLPASISKGQVNLQVTMVSNQMIVNVVEMCGVSSSKDSTYVQTMLLPDVTKSSLREGSFDERISYDLTKEDEKKRLMVSVCSKDSNSSCGKLIGCMSFGIKHLFMKNKKKVSAVDGWYYLLPENLGQRKHLAVPSNQDSIKKPEQDNATYDNIESIQLQKKLHNTDKFEVVVPRCSSGYGFTIKGTMPVRIGRVKPDGAAEKLGLLRGDYILSLNNTDTTHIHVDTVASMVRNSLTKVHMLIARPKKSSPTKIKSPDTSSNTPNATPVTAAEKVSNWGADLSRAMLASINEPYAWQPELSIVPEEKTTDFTSSKIMSRRETPSQNFNPDLSSITRFDESTRFINSQIQDRDYLEPIYEEINPADMIPDQSDTCSYITQTERSVSSCEPDNFTDSDNTTLHHNTLDSQVASSYRNNLMRVMPPAVRSNWLPAIEDDSRHQGPFSSEEGSLEETRQQLDFSSESDESIAGRETAIQQLLIIEQDFTRLMKRGIQRFSRPLRHQILTRSQHAILFQNIEKLVALSEFHIRQMLEKSYCAEDSYITADNDVTCDSVGSIYESKIKFLCQAYNMYCEGLGKALCLIETLRAHPKFSKFIQRIENSRGFEMTLSEFIQQPLTHFQQLVGSLGRVLLTTSPKDHDYNSVTAVMEAVHRSVSPSDAISVNSDDSCSSYNSRYHNSSTSSSRWQYSRSTSSHSRSRKLMTSLRSRADSTFSSMGEL